MFELDDISCVQVKSINVSTCLSVSESASCQQVSLQLHLIFFHHLELDIIFLQLK